MKESAGCTGVAVRSCGGTGQAASARSIAIAGRLPGDLDLPALRHALDVLVTRSMVLRNAVRAVGEEPVQVINEHPERWACDGDERWLAGSELTEWLEYIACQYLDLSCADFSRGPLLRIYPCSKMPGETLILVAAYRLIIDMSSMTNLVRDLEALYAEQAGMDPVRLPATEAPYQDFVRVHRWARGSRASVYADF
jgi:hypothetical protein